jgi:hypothetical protein
MTLAADISSSFHDLSTIAKDLRLGGFSKPVEFTTMAARSRADTSRIPAIAWCHGRPLRNEIEMRDSLR